MSGGAHGVIATGSGYFVAPVGPDGYLVTRAAAAEDERKVVRLATKKSLYLYKATCVPGAGSREYLAFAARGDGIAVAEFARIEGGREINSMPSLGIDVVDICNMGRAASRPAVAAVGRGWHSGSDR